MHVQMSTCVQTLYLLVSVAHWVGLEQDGTCVMPMTASADTIPTIITYLVPFKSDCNNFIKMLF